MRQQQPFQASDLAELDSLLAKAAAVVPMREIFEDQTLLETPDPAKIGVRHDVDNDLGPALAFARWENARGYRSTYFLLHTADYWRSGGLPSAVTELLELGHEVGFHCNAIAEYVRTGRDPHDIIAEALRDLRDLGAEVVGTVAHGDRLCREKEFINDEVWEECVRFGDELWLGGGPHRIGSVPVERRPLAFHGLTYDSNWLHRPFYASDSGGVWQGAVDRVPGHGFSGQLHLLIHPCWWRAAF